MLAALLAAVGLIFLLAYRTYGGWIADKLGLDDRHVVPAESMYDGTDFVPSRTPVLFGHHFSSIAGAGPIVGPVLAGLFFGWVPAVLWIVLGSILVGGVHDFGSLVASIRHKARSVAELARDYMSDLSFKLFLAFIWLTLVYVIVVFLDLTAVSFMDVPAGEGETAAAGAGAQGTGVAVASGIFIGLAILMGLVNRRTDLPLWATTLPFVLALLVVIAWAGTIHSDGGYIPDFFADPKHMWLILLLAYCLLASVAPVWILLQPRDYLSSFLLYLVVLGGGVGILMGSLGGGLEVTWPAFVNPQDPVFQDIAHLGPLFPILFITVACGACSGFHSIVASGTTSKQLECESDAKRIGYGAMLVEGVVAFMALATVMVLTFSADAVDGNPVALFSAGVGTFLETMGIPFSFGSMLGLLALSTFLLTTLDTCTRLGRYVLQELFGWDNSVAANRWKATILTLVLPTALAFMTYTTADGQVIPVWRAIWPVFGATNQLLAGLALLAVTIWLKRTGRTWLFAGLPMLFMVGMTMTALWMLVTAAGTAAPVRIIAVCLFTLGGVLVVEAFRAFRRPETEPETVLVRGSGPELAPVGD